MQNFFSNLFKNKDDSPIGLVSLGIQRKNKACGTKSSLAYNFDKVSFSEKNYDDKKILTIHDFID
jgi:hypothetical protein